MRRIIIPGPPGTGKTHRLMELLDNELNLVKTIPEKIAYIAFSNAAANEAKKRITNVKMNLLHLIVILKNVSCKSMVWVMVCLKQK